RKLCSTLNIMIATRPRILQFLSVAIPLSLAFVAACTTSVATSARQQNKKAASATRSLTYLGFDRNEYPGDDTLSSLRATFAFTGYWLNNPPGTTSNSWAGKRKALLSRGFGFLVLFNGRLDKEIKAVADPAALGRSDADQAVQSASKEGFPKNTII